MPREGSDGEGAGTDYVEEWFAHADRDLAGAEVLLDAETDPLLAAVQAQQAMEKALKGYLLSMGWSLQKTHDLTYLRREVAEAGLGLDRFEQVCAVATEAYVEERYPGTEPSGMDRPTAQRVVSEGSTMVALLREEALG